VNDRYDVVVVGAGHNGLVAGVTLARAGWRVLIVEANDRAGGALQSGELTHPGYVHDLFATNLNLFLASKFYAENGSDLARHGFVPATSRHAFASAFPDGTALGVSTDVQRTLDDLAVLSTADAAGWRDLSDLFGRVSPTLFNLYGSRVPSLAMVRSIVGGLRQSGRRGVTELPQLLVSSIRELVEERFESEKAKALIAPWGMHLDFGPDVAGGAVFPLLEVFTDQKIGISITTGGASRLVEALIGLFGEHGGRVRTSSRVTRVITSGGRARGVELADGQRVEAARAVVASVTPTALAGHLLSDGDMPSAVTRRLLDYRYGPSTMMLHIALSAPVPWAAGDWLQSYAYVHLAPYLDDLARTYTDALAGRLPLEPLLVVGQTSAVDRTRCPSDGHIIWVQVRALPSRIVEDPVGRLAGLSWDEAGLSYAERVVQKLEVYAPGISSLITGQAVLSPTDLERHDVNLVGGDSISGSMHLRQNFVFRPTAGMSGYRTVVPGLWLIGASTWPGAGLNAVSGYEAAQAILRQSHDGVFALRRLITGG